MNWYYVDNKERVGPVDESEFKELVSKGTINPQTLVWNESLTEWKPYQSLDKPSVRHGQAPVAHGDGQATCTECGGSFPPSDLISYDNARVCAGCKPVLVQKIKEGVALGGMAYGGFWIRVAAKSIDGIILMVVNLAMGALAAVMALSSDVMMAVITSLLQLAVGISYSTFFLGRFAATPGKMACGLKVVTAENGKVTYGKALGRHFSELLSSLILLIGYIMAAFDPEKRALHDRICDTRVIEK